MEIYTLSNGLTVVLESLPYVRSTAIGIWIGAGSRRETVENNGISHFIEHMLFKGTEKRSAKDIAEFMDSIGGQMNAFTGKENTCYYAKTLDTHTEKAVELLTDMLFHSTFTPENIEMERKVILEEIKMYEDSPEDLVYDNMTEKMWAGDALGMSILGTEKSLFAIDRSVMHDYMKDYYRPTNTVVSVVGNFDVASMKAMLSTYFSPWQTGSSHVYASYHPLEFQNGVIVKEKDIEQVHLCIGYPSFPSDDDRFYSLQVMNAIFGGGMSSRIFQSIREEKGLAYSVFSQASRYQKVGVFSIYGGFNPTRTEEVLFALREEVKKIRLHGVNDRELTRAKEQIKGNFIMSLESISTRMQYWGKHLLTSGKIHTMDEMMGKIDVVTEASISEVAEILFSPNRFCLSAVGAIKDPNVFYQY